MKAVGTSGEVVTYKVKVKSVKMLYGELLVRDRR